MDKVQTKPSTLSGLCQDGQGPDFIPHLDLVKMDKVQNLEKAVTLSVLFPIWTLSILKSRSRWTRSSTLSTCSQQEQEQEPTRSMTRPHLDLVKMDKVQNLEKAVTKPHLDLVKMDKVIDFVDNLEKRWPCLDLVHLIILK
jgi:hypothetical protein